MALAKRIVGRFHDQFDLQHFDYWHPMRLQKRVPTRFRKPYPVKVAYTEWGDPSSPTVVCCGGVANTAMRFNYLASDLDQRLPRGVRGLGRPRPLGAGWPTRATTRSAPTWSSCAS